MRPRYHVYLPLVAGALTPWLVVHVLQTTFGTPRFHKPYIFDVGAFVFVIALSMIPFAALIVLMLVISKATRARRELIFWGGLIPAWGFTAYYHWAVWHPIYEGERMHSTFAIVFLFIPLYVLFYTAVGVLVGWAVSLLPGLARLVATKKG